MVRWSKLRDILRKGEWYAFSAVCFLAGVVAGREIELLGRPEPINALIGVGVAVLAYLLMLLTATIIAGIRELREQKGEAPKTI